MLKQYCDSENKYKNVISKITNSPIKIMVERFVQSLATANDSGSFDTSFEVKPLIQRTKSKCVTELDRENLMKFVKEFEERKKNNINKSSSPILEKNSMELDKNYNEEIIYANIVITPKVPLKLDVNQRVVFPVPTQQIVKILENELPKLIINPPTPLASPEPDVDILDEFVTTSHDNLSLDLPKSISEETISTDSDFGSSGQEDDEDDEYYEEDADGQLNITVYEAKTPENLRISQNDNSKFSFKKPLLSSSAGKPCNLACKSAKVLQFLTSAGKKIKKIKRSSSSCSANSSLSPKYPIDHNNINLIGVKPLSNVDSDEDDGICFLGASNSVSPDSSFEMQPPIAPTFKVTPPSSLRQFGNPAYELARILRGSFNRGSTRSKRASIARLRRSISNPDNYQLNEIFKQQHNDDLQNEKIKDDEQINDEKFKFVEPKEAVTEKCRLGAALIRNLDVICSRALPSNTSPFRRWGQSSFRAPRTTEPRPQLGRRPSSLAASENDVYTKSMDDFIDDINSVHSSLSGGVSNTFQGETNINLNTNSSIGIKQSGELHNQSGGVQSWGNSFEKLLEDPAGLHTFAEFLKKEFSAENIYFWTACERYRFIENDKERVLNALEIFSKHLDGGCTEPVNVDSQARNITEDNLNIAEKNLFNQAQKQIFNLMKFDSYQRFIRSDLYKKCIDAEAKNQPLPYPGELLDDNLKTGNLVCPGPSKLKKSASNAEDRRRKSLLPWHRKTRCKSRDRANTGDSESIQSLTKSQSSANNSLKHLQNTLSATNNINSTSDLHSSRSSLSSFDTTTSNGLIGSDEYPLCRIILSDGATTIVPTRSDETIRQLIDRLLEKRGIQYQFYDIMYNGQTKAIDLDKPSNILANKEVQIEQRVAFKLDLPDPKVISVKSKPKKQLCDVLKPILQKYNYCFNDVQILMRETHEYLDLTLPVTVADGQRLQVVMVNNSDTNVWQQQQKIRNSNGYHPHFQTTKNNLTGNSVKLIKQGLNSNGNTTQQSTLDEITNKVFNELLQGKVESHANGLQSKKSADLCSLRSDDCTSETSSIFDRLKRRDSNIPGLKNFKPKKSLSYSTYYQPNKLQTTQSDDTLSTITQNTCGSDPTSAGIKKPLIAKWKTGVKLQVTGRPQNHSGQGNQDEFLEGLKRAQRARLEDQRGTEINFELPDFLKDKANLSAANKLRKIRANLSPINQNNNSNSQNGKLLTQSISGQLTNAIGANNTDNLLTNNNRNSLDSAKLFKDRPQPAPRLSISKMSSSVSMPSPNTSISGGSNTSNNSIGPESTTTTQSTSGTTTDTGSLNISNSSSTDIEYLLDGTAIKGPPPLPPKPKILPIKPSNWGQNNSGPVTNSLITPSTAVNNSTIPVDSTRRTNNNLTEGEINSNNVYLDQPSSSFV